MSQAPGLSGIPVRGQASSALRSASCASSSASPTSRTRRVSAAIRRADSMRQTASMVRWTSVTVMVPDDTILTRAVQAKCILRDSGRLLAVHHPRDPEAVRAHAEAVGPEGLRERHADAALARERDEDALGLGGVLHREEHVEALRRLKALPWRIAAHDRLVTKLQARVNDLVAHLGWRLAGGRGFTVGHGEGDAAAQNGGVEVKGFTAVALEVQVGAGLHGRSLRMSDAGAARGSVAGGGAGTLARFLCFQFRRRLRELLRLEHAADLDRLGAFLERGTADPFHRLLDGFHLPQPETCDELLRLGERTVDHRALATAELHAHAPGACLQPLAGQHHARLDEFLVELAHLRQLVRAWQPAGLRIGRGANDYHDS